MRAMRAVSLTSPWGDNYVRASRTGRAVWRRAPRTTGTTSRPPLLCLGRRAERPHVVITPWAVKTLVVTEDPKPTDSGSRAHNGVGLQPGPR